MERNDQFAGGQGWFLEGSQCAGEMGCHKLHEIWPKKPSEDPHLMQNKPPQKHSLGAGWLERSFVENDLEVLVLNKLNMSQQCASAAEG